MTAPPTGSPSPRSGPERDYDVLVVGSGFGGSVSALRLTEKGYRVGVLEAGARFADDDLPDIVYLEHLTGAVYLDKRDDVLRHLHVMESISVRAARPADSAGLLAAIAKEI